MARTAYEPENVPCFAALRPQAEIAAHIATSLEALLVAQRLHEGQRREVTDP